MDDKYRSRKFMIACTSLAMSCFFLWFDKLTGDNYVMVVAAIIGLYGYSNIKDK